jgi:hypothetical protein
VYKGDTCPGTKDYPSSYSYCGYSSSYGFSGNPPYNINRTVSLEHTNWKHYVDINYDHISSVYTGRTPNWKLIIIGIILVIIGIILTAILGIIGKPKTIISGCNGKIEENGESLEFMKKLNEYNEYRLKYLGRI